jgi:hypothetical protein
VFLQDGLVARRVAPCEEEEITGAAHDADARLDPVRLLRERGPEARDGGLQVVLQISGVPATTDAVERTRLALSPHPCGNSSRAAARASFGERRAQWADLTVREL